MSLVCGQRAKEVIMLLGRKKRNAQAPPKIRRKEAGPRKKEVRKANAKTRNQKTTTTMRMIARWELNNAD